MKIVTVVALAMVFLGSRTSFANSDGKIPLPSPQVVVRVILPSVQRNPMTLAAPVPGPTGATSVASTFLMDILSGSNYHPDFGAFNDYINTSICFDGRNVLGSLGAPWQLIGLGVESHFSSFTVRAGMKQNLFSIGGGVRIKGFEINCTFHTLGFAEHAISGLSVDGVFRL